MSKCLKSVCRCHQVLIVWIRSNGFKTEYVTKNYAETRMHSSRMRTVHCSNRLLGLPGGGVCLPGGCVWPGRVSGHGGCLPRGCLPRRGVCQGGLARGGVWPGGVWPGGIVCVSLCVPVNRMTDRCLLKHYLAATTLRTVISSSRVTDSWLYLNNDSLSMIVLIYSDKCSCWPLNVNMFNYPCLCQHSNPK